ncbi:Dynein 1b light intermediate chain, partial [Globisporangium splendens]
MDRKGADRKVHMRLHSLHCSVRREDAVVVVQGHLDDAGVHGSRKRRQTSAVVPEELATADGKNNNANVLEERDTFTLTAGSKESGKTSLTATFRNSAKADETKPATALDYVFVRLKGSNGARPPVAHMWELAKSKCVNEIVRVPLAAERILNGASVLALDLSTPGDIVPYLIKWLHTLYKCVHDVLKIKEKNSVDKFAVDKLKQEAMGRYGSSHPGKDEVVPMPLLLLILGNKYDAFRDEDSVKRKGIIQAVRYLAHLYGATVLFTSTKDKNLVMQFRSAMKNFAFRAPGATKGSKEVDIAKPLFVPAGADLFEDIGMPKTVTRHEFNKEQHEECAKQWKEIASEYYLPSGDVTGANQEDELDSKEQEEKDKYPEPNIDRVR